MSFAEKKQLSHMVKIYQGKVKPKTNVCAKLCENFEFFYIFMNGKESSPNFSSYS